jgi:hypothetical protein
MLAVIKTRPNMGIAQTKKIKCNCNKKEDAYVEGVLFF